MAKSVEPEVRLTGTRKRESTVTRFLLKTHLYDDLS